MTQSARILLTGGHGMVGRNVRAHPKARGFEILAHGLLTMVGVEENECETGRVEQSSCCQ